SRSLVDSNYATSTVHVVTRTGASRGVARVHERLPGDDERLPYRHDLPIRAAVVEGIAALWSADASVPRGEPLLPGEPGLLDGGEGCVVRRRVVARSDEPLGPVELGPVLPGDLPGGFDVGHALGLLLHEAPGERARAGESLPEHAEVVLE